jgi:hypothetical protein
VDSGSGNPTSLARVCTTKLAMIVVRVHGVKT